MASGFGEVTKGPLRALIILMVVALVAEMPFVMNLMASEIPKYWCKATSDKNVANITNQISGKKNVNFYILEADDRNACLILEAGRNWNKSSLAPKQCSEWHYDTASHETTMATEFQLYCQYEWLAPLSLFLFMLSMFIGEMIAWHLESRVKNTQMFIPTITVIVIAALGSACSTNYIQYIISQMILGGSAGAALLYSFVSVLRITLHDIQRRNLLLCCFAGLLGLGKGLVCLLASSLRNWRLLLLSLVLPTFFLIVAIWFTSKSSIQEEFEKKKLKIVKTFENLTKTNGGDDSTVKNDSSKKSPEKTPNTKGNSTNQNGLYQLLQCNKNTSLMVNCWFLGCLTFYGLTIVTLELGGNVYINLFASVIIEVVAATFTFLISYRSKKFSSSIIICSLALSGGFCLFSGFSGMKVLGNLCGKFGLSVALGSLSLLILDSIPVDLQATAIKVLISIASFTGIFSPFIISLQTIFDALPTLSCGVLIFIQLITLVFTLRSIHYQKQPPVLLT